MAFTATGQDMPVPTRRVGERIDIEAQFAFLAAGQMGRGQLPRQSSIAFRAASQHQQMRARRIRLVGTGAGPKRQFGPEYGTHVQFHRRFREPHRPIEAVMVGQRDGAQIQPDRLFDQLLRRAGPVEEAERRMRVQLGVRDGRANRPVIVRRLVAHPLTRQRDVIVRSPHRWRAGTARLTGEHPLHLRPARRTIAETHAAILSNICSTDSSVFAVANHMRSSSPASTELAASVRPRRTAWALATQSGSSVSRLTSRYSSGMKALGLRSVLTPRPRPRFTPGSRTTTLS